MNYSWDHYLNFTYRILILYCSTVSSVRRKDITLTMGFPPGMTRGEMADYSFKGSLM
jgi:hypothetical protein